MDPLAQIPLNINLPQESTFNNFVVGENQLLITALQEEPSEQSWCLLLWGKPNSGKTHLLQAVCHAAKQRNKTAMYLSFHEVKNLPTSMLENLEQYDVLALDDIDVVLDDPVWCEAIFHLYNRAHAEGIKLIISTQQAAQQLTCQLADLASRLNAATIFQIKALDDEQKKQFLQQKASQLGMHISQEVIDFLLHHHSRDIRQLHLSLQTLDQASLIHKQRITIPLVKKTLQL